jgi:excisionase family DNA binding protein
MPRIRDDELLLDLPEAIEYLRISRSTIYRLMRSGRLVGRKVGRKWLFYKKDLVAVVEASAPLPRRAETEQRTGAREQPTLAR